jgi:branched-chain amino acid transport system substrate-binding protein
MLSRFVCWLRPTRSASPVTTALLLAAFLVTLASCGGDEPPPAAAHNTLTIGALLSLTGNWASLGQNSQATLEFAVTDVNAYLGSVGSTLHVTLQVEDTKLDPAGALEKLQLLNSRGVKVVIGPQSSAEVRALEPFADSNGVILISQGSTAHSLATAGDNVFRLTPDDVQEAVAVAALMVHDGKSVIVPMTREDPGNQGLQTSAKATLESADATLLPEISYDPATQDFAPTVQALAAQVDQAVAQHGANTVAVYLTAFDEAASIFTLAAQSAALRSVRWYGSDGVAGSGALVDDAAAAAFATSVGFPCPIFGLDPAAKTKWEPLSERVHAQTGLVPDAFALSTYDAVWLTTLAALETGGVGDPAAFKRAFTQTANSYFGVTGSTELNDAGDRKSGTFDFQGICPQGTSYRWQSVGTFTAVGGALGTIMPGGCLP